jgi:hypothetical protein
MKQNGAILAVAMSTASFVNPTVSTAEPAQHRSEAARVLTKACQRAAETLGLSRKELAGVLGISAASLSRLGRSRWIDPESKEGELALLLLRLFRSLDALLGGSGESCRAWMRAPNRHLRAIPAELTASVAGLVHVTEYLDALRGKG